MYASDLLFSLFLLNVQANARTCNGLLMSKICIDFDCSLFFEMCLNLHEERVKEHEDAQKESTGIGGQFRPSIGLFGKTMRNLVERCRCRWSFVCCVCVCGGTRCFGGEEGKGSVEERKKQRPQKAVKYMCTLLLYFFFLERKGIF